MKESYNQVMRLRFRHFDIEKASRIRIKFSQGKRKMLVEYDASDESSTKKVWFDSESKLLCVKWTREDTWRFDSGAEIEGDAMIFCMEAMRIQSQRSLRLLWINPFLARMILHDRERNSHFGH